MFTAFSLGPTPPITLPGLPPHFVPITVTHFSAGLFCFPTNMIHRPNAGLMLARRLRRQPNINPALGQCIVFTGLYLYVHICHWKLCSGVFSPHPPVDHPFHKIVAN